MLTFRKISFLQTLPFISAIFLFLLLFSKKNVNQTRNCLLYTFTYCPDNNNNEWFPAGIKGDNITGYPFDVVPNIVHYILLDINEIQFIHFISILSVLKHHKPDEIIFHCNCHQIVGNNWNRVLTKANSTKTKISINKISKPTQIYGKKLSAKWMNWHASDVLRITVMKQFGGIYLDNDIYVVKSLHEFRKFELTLNWDLGHVLGSQVIIGNRNARFLHLWLEMYRYYDATQWYYTVGHLPTQSILQKYPHLIHRMTGEFGISGYQTCYDLFRIYLPTWRNKYYTVHCHIRGDTIAHNWCISIGLKSVVMKYDEDNVKYINNTFAAMARLVLYGRSDLM